MSAYATNEMDFRAALGFVALPILECVDKAAKEDGVTWYFERAWYDANRRTCMAIFSSHLSSGHQGYSLGATAIGTGDGMWNITVSRELGPELKRRVTKYTDVPSRG